ncbi:8-oxo-dGTP diphosphatase [Clostridium botulinum]|uniref:DNA mismatch repair protein MutT n=1 Tax=Clostridium botulinum C/D str. DC5 TaxID=1443128 RepID=A0A0A0IJ45_CLOBO|nr:8-oxo-dGTP diphosphatase [Clostridium botulinum]KEI05480.1 DNA mismatch repair protein MutT [Clostridium botulinum C/D str. BKT75002]KEI09431.1 DNA mismatch repair protein MutT [Clostridium botulinum C/D str. BKT2873]KGM94391.1 DNA mismatch repair protein MutT [Clostridium botulinum D str. CCUG 7971]KGN00242.1 DNA mismatch repair protein MutT [Clostridium botulinum C/D str. DC5]KOC50179.1 DNA mismatch repair protein MutT [Clostridium botulinum]
MKVATLCYIENDNKILLLHRVKKKDDVHEGKWIGVGGKVEQGETPEECVIREVKEETGLDIKNPKLRGILTFPNFDGVDDWYVFVFTVNKYNGKIIECNEGNLKWIEKSKVLDMPSWEGDKIFIEWILKNKPVFSAKFIYKDGKLTDYNVDFYS